MFIFSRRIPWKFHKSPRSLSADPTYLKAHFSDLERALKIDKAEDWYRISRRQVSEIGLRGVVNSAGSLYNFLREFRPDIEWDESRFIGVVFFGERLLGSYLRKIFLKNEILESYQINPLSTSKLIQSNVRFYIPELKLAVDYQKDNYYGLENVTGTVEVKLKMDEDKLSWAKENNLTIIFIPFWWNRSIESLIETIAFYCETPSSESMLENIGQFDPKILQAIPNETILNLSSWRQRRSE